jgi:hypothetical protein
MIIFHLNLRRNSTNQMVHKQLVKMANQIVSYLVNENRQHQ